MGNHNQKYKDISFVKPKLRKSTSDSQLKYRGRSPFDPLVRTRWASERRKPLTLKEVIKNRENLIDSPSLLHMACRLRDYDAIRFLTNAGEDVNSLEERSGKTPLQLVLEGDRWSDEIEVLKIFISNGSRLDVTASDGWSILHSASLYGDFPFANDLMKRGVDPNITTSTGLTPLHIACNRKDTIMIKTLIESRANAMVETVGGTTPLDFVMREKWPVLEEKVTAMKMLTRNGGDRHEGTPLHVACIWKNSDMVEYLLRDGEDKTMRDSRGLTALESVRDTLPDGLVKRDLLEILTSDIEPSLEKRRNSSLAGIALLTLGNH